MPSKKTSYNHQIFLPLVLLVLVFWTVYRSVFSFPVWFDEMIGKMIFFGLPVWLYMATTNFRMILDSWSFDKLYRGLLLGLAFGGVFGFAASIVRIMLGGGVVISAPLFMAQGFWWEFFLGLMTGFWETLFFFSFVMLVIFHELKKMKLWQKFGFVTLIFVLFHIPNAIALYQGVDLVVMLVLMILFALGQSLVFWYRQNAYALVMIHVIWGMTLLLHVL